MTQSKKYCANCFHILLAEAAICDRCQYEQFQEDSPLYLKPPFRLHDQFYIGRVLGHGGFAITYLAYDRNLSMPVAIKEYFPIEFANRAADGQSVTPYAGQAGELFQLGKDKFLAEARLLANFRSPNIIKIRQFFQACNTAYFVMEYIDGDTLSDYIKQRGGKLSFAEVRKILLPLLDALEEVHHKNIFHRDIKPDNIYMTRAGEPILLDFGAARQSISGRTTHLMAFLTPGFAPAEQYSINGIQGPWTDIYSLAATAYFALTGSLPPIPGDRILGEAELIAPSKLGSDIPAQDEEWLMQALSIRWSQRPDSVKSWRELIEQPVQSFFVDPYLRVKSAEENFTKIAILPKLTHKLLTRRDEQEIYASAAFMEISLDRVRDLIEESMEALGARRLDAAEEQLREDELQQRAEELQRKEEELKRFEELRAKEEEIWWQAEMAEREEQKRLQLEAQEQQRQEAQRLELEKQKHDQEIRLRAEELRQKEEELKRFEELRRKEEEVWWQAEQAQREAQQRQEAQRLEQEKLRHEQELRQREEELKQKELELQQLREAELRLKEEMLRLQAAELKRSEALHSPISADQAAAGMTDQDFDELGDISEDEVSELIKLFADKPSSPKKARPGLSELDIHYARIAAEISQVPIARQRLLPPGKLTLPARVTNSLGMDFVLVYPSVPGTGFVMLQTYAIGPSERGFQTLSHQPFYLQTTPVTQKQWLQLMQNQPAYFDHDPMLPVEQVSWDDCQLFIHCLNQMQEANYRLPSEVEWDFACRAGSRSRFFFGDDAQALGDYAWFEGNSQQSTQPVGLKRPNPFKLFDMLGNIREWVQDRYIPLEPEELSSPVMLRTVRNGGWDADPDYCLSGQRSGAAANLRVPNLGFRLAMDIH